MSLRLVLSVLFLFHFGITFRLDDGCEAKAEWKVDVRWNKFQIGVWISEDDPKIMELLMTFASNEDLFNDKIVVFNDNYDLHKRREEKKYFDHQRFDIYMKDGWANFVLRIEDKYRLWYVSENDYHLLLEDDVDIRVTSLIIKGRNVTVNCPDAMRMWHITGSSLSIPLDGPSNQLSFYSTQEALPSITLGHRTFLLSWDGQEIYTKDGAHLPPFRIHNITISYNGHENVCNLEVAGRSLEGIYLKEMPKSVMIRSQINSFSVILPINSTTINQQHSNCKIKQEWAVETRWSQYLIGAWISHDKPLILKFVVTFENFDEFTYFDNIVITNNSYEVVRQRDLKRSPDSKIFSTVMREGWNEFLFTIDEMSYSISYKDANETHLLFREITNNEFNPKKEWVEGSNLTLNCPSEVRSWYVTEDTTVVPVGDLHSHQLTFFSTGNMMPSVSIGSRNIPLRWDGNTITSVHDAPLPPFILHNISVTCTSQDITLCIIQTNQSRVIEDVRLRYPLKFIKILKDSADPFQVLISEHIPQNATQGITNQSQSSIMPNSSYAPGNCSMMSFANIWMILVPIIIVSLIIGSVFGWFILSMLINRWKGTKLHAGLKLTLKEVNIDPIPWETMVQVKEEKVDDNLLKLHSDQEYSTQLRRRSPSQEFNDCQDFIF